MLNSRTATSVVAIALLASAGFVMADAPKMSLDATLPPSVASLQAAPAERAPLMAGLDYLGVAKTLDNLGINIYGYVQAGYYHDFGRGNNELGNAGIAFLSKGSQHLLMNGIDLNIERVIADRSKFDIGGRVEVLYGTDGKYLHSNGLNFYGDNAAGPDADPDDYQFTLVQAYIDVSLPVANGLLLRVGKFNCMMGYESTYPVTAPFYSHSYNFYCLPLTHSGVSLDYNFSEELGGALYVVRGYDQATKDVNDVVSYGAQVRYAPKAIAGLTTTLNVYAGPEGSSNGRWLQVYNAIASYKVNDALTVAAEFTYGNTDVPAIGSFTPYSTTSDRYDGVLYASYVFNKYVTGNARAEWVWGNVSNGTTGMTGNIFAFTLGTTLTPFPDTKYLSTLKVRPEVRWDSAGGDASGLFSGHDSQRVTAGLDIIYAF
ncbi:MAG: outer membrane beta-barrel protein [Phycisphaerae bacterium]